MFPSLVNNCTIDWFEKWPREALLSVAQNALQNLGDENMVTSLSNLCVIIHEVSTFFFLIMTSCNVRINGLMDFRASRQ